MSKHVCIYMYIRYICVYNIYTYKYICVYMLYVCIYVIYVYIYVIYMLEKSIYYSNSTGLSFHYKGFCH